jgi:hypothetical protein
METFKKYLPWIIGGVVLLFILSRLKTNLVPQTALTQTPQPDPYAADRATAFQSLIGLAGIQTQADLQREETSFATQLASRAQEIQRELGLKSFDVESSRINAAYEAALRTANLNFLQREQDRELQQSAINRAASSQTTQQILGSINTALSTIFANRGGSNPNVFGTPPTFPKGGFF